MVRADLLDAATSWEAVDRSCTLRPPPPLVSVVSVYPVAPCDRGTYSKSAIGPEHHAEAARGSPEKA